MKYIKLYFDCTFDVVLILGKLRKISAATFCCFCQLIQESEKAFYFNIQQNPTNSDQRKVGGIFRRSLKKPEQKTFTFFLQGNE